MLRTIQDGFEISSGLFETQALKDLTQEIDSASSADLSATAARLRTSTRHDQA